MRWCVLLFASIAFVGLALNYDLVVAGGVFLSSAAGYYLGGELAVPTLISMAKLGILDEEEIFSPFSTLVYDSIDIGKKIGALSGALLMKAVLSGFEPSLLMDFVVGCIMIDLASAFENYDVLLVPTTLGLALGVIW